MTIVLVFEILLFAAAFAALHRALRKRVDDALQWEASVSLEASRSASWRAGRMPDDGDIECAPGAVAISPVTPPC